MTSGQCRTMGNMRAAAHVAAATARPSERGGERGGTRRPPARRRAAAPARLTRSIRGPAAGGASSSPEKPAAAGAASLWGGCAPGSDMVSGSAAPLPRAGPKEPPDGTDETRATPLRALRASGKRNNAEEVGSRVREVHTRAVVDVPRAAAADDAKAAAAALVRAATPQRRNAATPQHEKRGGLCGLLLFLLSIWGNSAVHISL